MGKPAFNQKNKKAVSDERQKEIKAIKAKEKVLVKKIIVIFLAVTVLLIVLSLVLDQCSSYNMDFEKGEVYVAKEQVYEEYPTINPFPADFNKDLSGYNPEIMYEVTNDKTYSVSISAIPEESRNEAHRFFIKYFDVLKSGDSNSYGSLFSKTYKEDPRGFEKDFTRAFPPQELYDIRVEELQRVTDPRIECEYEGKDCFFGYYRVSYKIRKNDGYFRRDLYREEIERPLIFELVTFDKDTNKEVTYIMNMYTESSIKKEEK